MVRRLRPPAGTRSAVIARLNEEIGAIVGQAEVRERLANGGIEPLAGSTPEAMAATARDEFDRYGRMVREFRIQADRSLRRPIVDASWHGYAGTRASRPGAHRLPD